MAKNERGWVVGEGNVELAEFKVRAHAMEFKSCPKVVAMLAHVSSLLDRGDYPENQDRALAEEIDEVLDSLVRESC